MSPAGEKQRRGVDASKGIVAAASSGRSSDEARASSGDEHAGRAAEHREQTRLGEELPDELQPARADREPDGHLVGARGGAREQQVGDVGAGDEQHERGDAEQEQERRFASSWTELWPRCAASTWMALALNRAIVWSLMPCCSGASTSLTIGGRGTLIAVFA